MNTTKRRAILAAILATPALAAGAQTARPIRFIVPFPPGGTADLLARLVAREMESRLGAGRRHHIGHRAKGAISAHGKRHGAAADHGDRREILFRVIG